MKADTDKLARLRQERDTLRATVETLEEIHALQERLRALQPVIPYVPMPYPAYPVVPGPVIPWRPWNPLWYGNDTHVSTGTTNPVKVTSNEVHIRSDDPRITLTSGCEYRS